MVGLFQLPNVTFISDRYISTVVILISKLLSNKIVNVLSQICFHFQAFLLYIYGKIGRAIANKSAMFHNKSPDPTEISGKSDTCDLLNLKSDQSIG